MATRMMAIIASSAVLGIRSMMISRTGRPSVVDTPNSALPTELSQFQYCTGSESLRPWRSRSFSSNSSACSRDPTSRSAKAASAASPGTSCIRENTRMVASNAVGNISRTRRTMYLRIASGHPQRAIRLGIAPDSRLSGNAAPAIYEDCSPHNGAGRFRSLKSKGEA